MIIRRHGRSKAVLLLMLLAGGSSAFAQTGRTWVDPPADLGSAPKPMGSQAQPAESQTREPIRPDQPSQASVPQPTVPSAPVQAARPPASPSVTGTTPRQAARPSPEKPASPVIAIQPRDPGEPALANRAEAAQELAINYLNSWSASNAVALGTTAEFYAPRVLFHGRPMSAQALLEEKRRFVRRWPERRYRPHQDSMQVTCNPSQDVCTVQSLFDFTAASPDRGRISQGLAALQLVVSFAGDRPVITAETSTTLDRGRGGRTPGFEGASNE